MSGPRDYSITIRNQAQTYIGKNVQDRNYAKVSSSEAKGDEGVITLQLDRGKSITLKAHEAIKIGETLARAGHGARKDRLGDTVTSTSKQVSGVGPGDGPNAGPMMGFVQPISMTQMQPLSPELQKMMKWQRS